MNELKQIFVTNYHLFYNSIFDLNEECMLKRVEHTNHSAYIACHLVDTRYYILKNCKIEFTNPFANFLKDAKTIDDVKSFPSKQEILNVWQETHKIFLESLDKIDLNNYSIPFSFPYTDKTTISFLTFMAQHESFHIGQLAFLHKVLNDKAMTYKQQNN
jgi:uncharacterized damage-inducible protein DinB